MTVRKMREKRMLLFMPEYVMGGAETQFRYLIQYVERMGLKMDVVIEHCFHNYDPLLKQDAARMKHVRFYELCGYRNGQQDIVDDAVRHILVHMIKINYTVCLIYYVQDIALVPVLRSLGIRVVYSERVDAANITENLYWKKCLRYCEGVFANSMHAQKVLECVLGRKVGLIRNGKPFVEQLAKKAGREIRRCLIPARIVPHKNQMLTLQYLRKYPDFTGKFIFAGIVEDKEYQRKLLRFVSRFHLEERVEFLGYVEDMRVEYEKADLIILPSFSEGTPNVVLEAYAYGRPVIVSDIKAEREVVRDACLRFKPGIPDEMNKCIEYIGGLSDEAYSRMMEKNREFVLKNYNMDKMVRQFYKVLTEK